MMDRGRPSRHDHLPPSSTSSTSGPARLKQAASPTLDSVKRKPLPSTTSPITTRKPLPPLSSGGIVVAVGEDGPNDYSKNQSFLHDPPSLPPIVTASPPLVPRDLDQYPRGLSPQVQNGVFSSTISENTKPSARPHRTRQASESKVHETPKVKRVPVNEGVQRSNSLHPAGRPMNDDFEPSDPTMITKTPRSPGPNKLTSFFGWKTSSPIAEVSPTTYSDASHSPVPSPMSPSPPTVASSVRSIPNAIDVPKANANMNNTFFADTGFPARPLDGALGSQSDDLEEELRDISAELAGSIRREMELEDLVDRLQLEASQGPELGRRTSDYFSDSGSGSVRYPMSDAGTGKVEDLAKQKRISEQEKAQFKVSLSQRLQDERGRRKVLEAHVQQLGEQMHNINEERAVSSGVANRVRDLESSLEDHRRRLHEEKKVKENVEDLLTAMKGEIGQTRDERDNLRDEIVPQLRARVEGLEAESAEYQKLTYENARMQQELQSLKNENTTLVNARRMQLEMQQHSNRFNSIAEEEDGPSPASGTGLGLTRSASVARGTGQGVTRAGSLKRSNSISSKEREFNERVKDIEMQRDALHRALKSLLDRQNLQNKEHEKKVKLLEIERDRAVQNQSPRKMGYEKEVTGLRYEINHLRRRADDAIHQKYQCEKGLGGLKKDLDRAEQETTSLRTLLQENDILIPELSSTRAQEIEEGSHATSASLEKAYRELQMSQATSITKLRELHGGLPSSADDADTSAMMDTLLKSMSNAETERDFAQKQAAIFRAEAESLKAAESYHSGENAGLADQLSAAANRVEALSAQVRIQLDSNSTLRQRLAEAVGKGEQEQKYSTKRINTMQGNLKALEDKLMTAQQQSEDTFAQHEEEVREIRESHNMQLQRLKAGIKSKASTVIGSPRLSQSTPLSPIFSVRSPKLDRTTSGLGMGLDQALRTDFLEKKVIELEGALGEADKEMEEVVSRMNLAQIEVMELQSARDEAMRQTRKLQAAINAERANVDALMN